MTFEEKLEKFKSERVGFRVSSEEIAKELVKVFTRLEMKPRGDYATVGESMGKMWNRRGVNTYVTYNYFKGEHKLSYGHLANFGKDFGELLDVTLEELKAYNG